MAAMNGRKTRSDQRIGSTVASATSVGNCSARDFGINSPTTRLKRRKQEEHGDLGGVACAIGVHAQPGDEQASHADGQRALGIRAEHQARER